MSPTVIRRLLVANRGEIAGRVFRTARAMGLQCVAVYAPADANSPFVADADEAVLLPNGYLDGDAIIAAAVATGADAIHPGYGFLSENAVFATAVTQAGLVWIGPSPEIIEAMGDKIAAKVLAEAAGVPTLASSQDVADAGALGYPILVKAAAGGGGKGMRIAADPSQLSEAVAAARREAASGFGDDRVFLERYLERARHIEIQILGDAHGGLLHLGERECSIQRRHQKIIEESPSSAVDTTLRTKMGAAALALAGALGYQSTGTVEFLLEETTGEFFFLEVNTRLQVEHPVTEAVTGIDLVREQIRIAAGEPLGYGQADVSWTGHAIEARLYAEDVAAGFLPAIGTLAAFVPPAEPEVRWDTGVATGSTVGLDFDPMLAKVIAHAPTRSEAAGRLALALDRLHVGGITTNQAFLTATLRHPAFLAGDTTTDFIERVRPGGTPALDDTALMRLAITAALWQQGHHRHHAPVLRGFPSGWRNARLPAQQATFARGEQSVAVTYRAQRDGSFRVGDTTLARVHQWSEERIDVEIDGRRSVSRITRSGSRLHIQTGNGTVEIDIVSRFPPPTVAIAAGGLVAPMPGVASDVRVAVGDTVTAGQILVVLEAMKMEHHITAANNGTVVEVLVRAGEQVRNSQVLLIIEAPNSPDEEEIS